MPRRTLTALTALAALALAACHDAAPLTAPSERPARAVASAGGRTLVSTTNLRDPYDMYPLVPCANDGAGEPLALYGALHVLFHLTLNGNTFVLKQHFQPQGVSGVGLTSGARYVATGVTQQTTTSSLQNGSFQTTYVNNYRLIGAGRAEEVRVHQVFHVTINAKGEITAVADRPRSACR